MEKHLQLLLKEVNTVIIPGLGALTITNHSTGEIMFMPYLKYDDGKLSSYISEKENIAEEEVKNRIAQKVVSILDSLDKGDSYYINNLGSFSKDKSGDICFISDFSDESTSTTQVEIKSNTEEENSKVEPVSIPENAVKNDNILTESIPVDINESEDLDKNIEETLPDIQIEKPIKKGFFSFLKKKKKVVEVPLESNLEMEVDDTDDQIDKMHNEFTEEAVEPIVVSEEVPIIETEINIETINEDDNVQVTSDQDFIEQFENTSSQSIDLNSEESTTIEEGLEIDSERSILESEVDFQNEDFPESVETKPKKKRGVGFWFLMFLMIFFVGGGTYIGLNFDKIKQYIPFSGHKEEATKDEKEIIKKLESDNTKPSDAIESDSKELIETSVETEEELPIENTNALPAEKSQSMAKSTSNSGGQSFHIILGSFSDKSNADKYVSKLNAEGKGSASTQEHEGKYLVSFASYSNIDDAKSNLNSAREISKNAWVLKP